MARCLHEKLTWLPREPVTKNARSWVLGCAKCEKPIGKGRGTIDIDVDDGCDW